MRRRPGSNQYKTQWESDLVLGDGNLTAQTTRPPNGNPGWEKYPTLWQQVLEYACNTQHQWQCGHASPIPILHPVTPGDVVQVLAQRPGDPEEKPGEGEAWLAVVRVYDNRYMLVQGYLEADDPGNISMVGRSLEDLANQLTNIAEQPDDEEQPSELLFDIMLEAADLLVDLPAMPDWVWRRWANSLVPELRWAVAGSPRIDQYTWSNLACDADGYVRYRALRNPVADPDALKRLATTWTDPQYASDQFNIYNLQSIAANPSCPRSVLGLLMSYDHPSVRQAVLRNPNCPEEYRVLARITNI